jgi:hypothetical protein
LSGIAGLEIYSGKLAENATRQLCECARKIVSPDAMKPDARSPDA